MDANDFQLFITKVYSQKRFEQLYSQIVDQIFENLGKNISDKSKKKITDLVEKEKKNDFINNIDIIEDSLTGDDENDKVLIYFLFSMINQFFYEDVIKNFGKYDFCFDYPLDVIFMVSISDFTPVIFSIMKLFDYDDENIKEIKIYDKIPELSNFLKMNDQNQTDIVIDENRFNTESDYITDHLYLVKEYLQYHIPFWEKEFYDQILKNINYQDLVEIAYSSTPDEDNFLIYKYFISKFINNESYRSTGIHDMIEFSNNLCHDYEIFGIEESKFFENAFLKLSDYFSQIASQDYSPFLSSSIYETIYKIKKLTKGKTRSNFKESMLLILEKTNKIKMNSDQQKESLPYYFLDLSGTPLHKLMELNPRTIIPFTLSPYLLKKDLPNIEVLIQTAEKSKKCQTDFDLKIFSCSPTADSTIAVVRDIFVEYDCITERLIDRKAPKSNIFKEKQTSPLPGMLIFKLSMLQWDFMPNFAQDMNFVPVFQVSYNSINKYALQVLNDDSLPGAPVKYYLDLHTADCNLCFYPLTESESKAIGKFFKDQIRIEEYKLDKLKRHFLEKTKSEMIQTASNFIPNMILAINKQKQWPKHPYDEIFDPNDPYDQKNDSDNPYFVMFKDFGNANTDQLKDKLEGIIHDLCSNQSQRKSSVLLLESVCYLCQKEPQCAAIVLDLFEKELKKINDEEKRKLMLTIVDRFIDPAILQNIKSLIDKAKKLTEAMQFHLAPEDKKKTETIDPDDLAKKVIDIAKGSHFFSLTSEDRNDRLGFGNVHREWLIKSIPSNNNNNNDDDNGNDNEN